MCHTHTHTHTHTQNQTKPEAPPYQRIGSVQLYVPTMSKKGQDIIMGYIERQEENEKEREVSFT
jgi:hypothetical protein